MNKFVPLHLHTEYSYLDSMSKPKEIAHRCKELGIKSCAVTDHGNLTGIINFYEELKKEGVKPIIGQEFYFTHSHEKKEKSSRHITIIAMNNEGLSNLYKLTTIANTPIGNDGGFYVRPRISWKELEKHHKGLIILSGCMNSPINHEFAKDDYQEGKYHAQHLLKIVGKDRFFVELQNVNEPGKIYIPEQEIILEHSRKLAKDLGLRSCATNDSHFVLSNDAFNHEVLKAIYSHSTMADPIKGPGDKKGRMVYNGTFYYIPSYSEMIERFTKEEVETTFEIAEMCNIDIPLKQDHMPKFDLKMSENEIYDLMLKECRKAYKKLEINNKPNKQEYINRIKLELKDIKEAGLQNYFMIVWDVMKFVYDNKIGSGFGRGSAGGSLILYLLGITKVDPLKYGLIWERFWNRGRKGSMPDIDLDIDIERRDEVIEYLREKFGQDKVFPMSTVSKMSIKAVLKDVGKVLGLNFDYMNELTKHVPHKCTSIANAIKDDEIIEAYSKGKDKDIEKWGKELEKNPPNEKQIKDNINERKRILKKTFEVASRLEDVARQRSSHACALLIADENIFGKIPLCWDAANKKLLTGWDMYDLEKLGYLKLDILGLKTISVLEKIIPGGVDNIKDFDDKNVYDLICTGNTKGIFQLESPLGKQWILKVKPRSLEDVADLISIIRPGVLETGLAGEYIENKFSGNTFYEYLHPDLKPILDKTYGIMCYQEQMLEIVKKFAGFDLSKADLLRKACGKKLPEEMAKYEKDFIDGCIKNKYSEEIAKKLWEWINATADYNFNKSHAIEYGMLSYATAYFKRYYPEKFFLSMLQMAHNEQKPQEEISELFYDSKLFKVTILPPSLKNMNIDFTLKNNEIIYGLKHIKHIGAKSIEKIIKMKIDSWNDVIINHLKFRQDIIYALILSGALDYLGLTRKQMKSEIDFLNTLTPREQIFLLSIMKGEDYIDKKKKVTILNENSFTDAVKLLLTFIKSDNERIKIFNSRRAPILADLCNSFISDLEVKDLTIKSKAAYEIEYLGIPATCSEVDLYDDKRKTHDLISVKHEINNKELSTIGIIKRITEKKDRRGNKFAFITLFDKTYMIDAVLWSDSYFQYKKNIVVGSIVFVEGIKRRNLFSINNLEVL